MVNDSPWLRKLEIEIREIMEVKYALIEIDCEKTRRKRTHDYSDIFEPSIVTKNVVHRKRRYLKRNYSKIRITLLRDPTMEK